MVDRDLELTIDHRREVIEMTAGAATGAYGPGYLDELREDWPD